ncbi:hypothetical protein DFH09DRAFT_1089207 [Mycena vulgaris]|nr:hypothetical protein DFH09DRAFT_1089207 [Mycena vulgaris]
MATTTTTSGAAPAPTAPQQQDEDEKQEREELKQKSFGASSSVILHPALRLVLGSFAGRRTALPPKFGGAHRYYPLGARGSVCSWVRAFVRAAGGGGRQPIVSISWNGSMPSFRRNQYILPRGMHPGTDGQTDAVLVSVAPTYHLVATAARAPVPASWDFIASGSPASNSVALIARLHSTGDDAHRGEDTQRRHVPGRRRARAAADIHRGARAGASDDPCLSGPLPSQHSSAAAPEPAPPALPVRVPPLPRQHAAQHARAQRRAAHRTRAAPRRDRPVQGARWRGEERGRGARVGGTGGGAALQWGQRTEAAGGGESIVKNEDDTTFPSVHGVRRACPPSGSGTAPSAPRRPRPQSTAPVESAAGAGQVALGHWARARVLDGARSRRARGSATSRPVDGLPSVLGRTRHTCGRCSVLLPAFRNVVRRVIVECAPEAEEPGDGALAREPPAPDARRPLDPAADVAGGRGARSARRRWCGLTGWTGARAGGMRGGERRLLGGDVTSPVLSTSTLGATPSPPLLGEERKDKHPRTLGEDDDCGYASDGSATAAARHSLRARDGRAPTAVPPRGAASSGARRVHRCITCRCTVCERAMAAAQEGERAAPATATQAEPDAPVVLTKPENAHPQPHPQPQCDGLWVVHMPPEGGAARRASCRSSHRGTRAGGRGHGRGGVRGAVRAGAVLAAGGGGRGPGEREMVLMDDVATGHVGGGHLREEKEEYSEFEKVEGGSGESALAARGSGGANALSTSSRASWARVRTGTGTRTRTRMPPRAGKHARTDERGLGATAGTLPPWLVKRRS